MTSEQFVILMPYITADLIAMMIDKKKIDEKNAIQSLYASRLYASLEKEDTKVWQYSTPMLFALLEQEEQLGEITFPDA